MPRELTAAQSVYLAAFERHLRAIDSPLEDVAVESKQDRLGRVLADAGVTPKRRPRTADDAIPSFSRRSCAAFHCDKEPR